MHFLFQQVFWRKRTEKAACPGSTLPVGAKIVEKAEKKNSAGMEPTAEARGRHPGPPRRSLHYKAENHTRGPRTIERSEIVWGGLSGVGSRKCASCFSRFLAEENGKKPFVQEAHFLLGEKIVGKVEKRNLAGAAEQRFPTLWA